MADPVTILGYVWSAVISYGINMTINNLTKQDSPEKKYFNPKDNTRSQELPIPIIYGENIIGGNLLYEKIRGDNNRYRDLQLGISEGPIQSITEIKVGEELISELDGCSARVKLGNRTQSADGINTKQTFPFLAYISATLDGKTLEDAVQQSAIITAKVQGLKVDVYNGTSWVNEYSQNPAYCLLDLLSNKRYGLGISKENIDLDSFIETANYCDELIDDGDGGQEKRFQLDIAIQQAKSSLDLIQDILGTFRGFLIYSSGEIRLAVDAPVSAPVQSFTMDNIVKDSFSYSETSKKDIYNRVMVQFIDPSNNDEKIYARYDDDYDIEKTGEIREKKVSLLGIRRFSQAGRMARFYLNQAKFCTTKCKFKAGIDSLHCEVGDVIKVSHNLPEWNEKLFRILKIEEDENDEMELTCQEYNESVYSDNGVVKQITEESNLPNPFEKPASVKNLSLTEQNQVLGDGTWIPGVKITWDRPDYIVWRYANIYISNDDGATWQFLLKVQGEEYLKENLAPGVYKIKVVSESKYGRKEDFGNAPVLSITIKGKDAKPSKVSWGLCDFTDEIVLRWQPINDIDVKAYEIRNDLNWGNSTGLIYRGLSLEYPIKNPTERAYTFYIKALDRSGNYSEEYSEITVTNSAPPAPATPKISEFFESILIEIYPVADEDLKGYKLYITESDGLGNALENADTQVIPLATLQKITYPADSGKSFLIECSAYDSLGEGQKSAPIEATTQSINNIAQFAKDIRPPKIVDSLPVLPSDNFPKGSTVVLTTDNKLYRSTGDSWTAEVETIDLSGEIQEGQIANEAISQTKIADNAVNTAKLALQAVTSDILAANSITEAKIADNAISKAKIAQNAVDTAQIALEAITESLISAGAITAEKIANQAVELTKFAAGIRPVQIVSSLPDLPNSDYPVNSLIINSADGKLYRNINEVWSSKIPSTDITGQITETQISDGSISTPKLQANAVTANEIASATITANEIASNTIVAGNISAGAIGVDEIAANAITSAKIAADAIVASKIASGAIETEHLKASAITAAKIAANTITSNEIATGTITANEIASNTITATQIASETITAAEIQAGAITTEKVNAYAITAAKLAIGSVIAEKIQAGAITSEKIYSEAVTAGKIAARAITADKIEAGAITTDKLETLAVTASKIATNAITTEKISADAITAGKIAAGAIGADEIAAEAITADKIGTNQIITHTANIKDGIIDSAKIINVEADKIKVGGNSTLIKELLSLNSSIYELEDNINSFSNDNLLTLAEANTLRTNYNQLIKESQELINQGNILDIDTKYNNEVSNYQTALTELKTELDNWVQFYQEAKSAAIFGRGGYTTQIPINPLNYPLVLKQTDRDNLSSKFEVVQSAKSELINRITEAREQLAKEYYDNSIEEDIDNKLTDYSSDSIVTKLEARTLRDTFDSLDKECNELINKATLLNITTEINSLGTSLNDADTYMSTWTNASTYPVAITSTQRANIKAKIDDVQTKKVALINAINAKIQAMEGITDVEISNDYGIRVRNGRISIYTQDENNGLVLNGNGMSGYNNGNKVFDFTNQGELKDGDGYTIISANGIYDGKIIEKGFGYNGQTETNFTIPEGYFVSIELTPFKTYIRKKEYGTGDYIYDSFDRIIDYHSKVFNQTTVTMQYFDTSSYIETTTLEEPRSIGSIKGVLSNLENMGGNVLEATYSCITNTKLDNTLYFQSSPFTATPNPGIGFIGETNYYYMTYDFHYIVRIFKEQ